MIAVLAIDALEYSLVQEFKCRNLMQSFFGKTDISEFSQPRTMVLWSSFITGKNKEKDVLADGNREMWEKKWPAAETFFSRFKSPVVIDLPGFSYDVQVHGESRKLLKAYFDAKSDGEKEKIKNNYNKDAFEHHKKIKEKFFEALSGNHDFVLGYFSVADVVGHLNFGNMAIMKMIYDELDDIAGKAAEKCEKLIVLSDHGMQAIGQFGDHSNYGFWSTNFKVSFKNPKITEIAREIF